MVHLKSCMYKLKISLEVASISLKHIHAHVNPTHSHKYRHRTGIPLVEFSNVMSIIDHRVMSLANLFKQRRREHGEAEILEEDDLNGLVRNISSAKEKPLVNFELVSKIRSKTDEDDEEEDDARTSVAQRRFSILLQAHRQMEKESPSLAKAAHRRP